MTARDHGFLLLTSHLGDPERKCLTVAQFRELTRRMRLMEKPTRQRDLTNRDLQAIGCTDDFAQRILNLLSQDEQLHGYLALAEKFDCVPITRYNPAYPQNVRKCLSFEAPGCLWAKGDLSILEHQTISLVGSRELKPDNRVFAATVGKQAARQGYALASGNARGADRTAQESCLTAGGRVISVVADALSDKTPQEGQLFLSEDGFDMAFSSQRALSRNRIIHSLGQKTFVAQCTLGKGGTWDGTVKNLRNGWSPVFCYNDGSDSSRELVAQGAVALSVQDLEDIKSLQPDCLSFWTDC